MKTEILIDALRKAKLKWEELAKVHGDEGLLPEDETYKAINNALTLTPSSNNGEDSAGIKELEEKHRMQLAGISTAAIGYFKDGDSINPDYDSVALRDVVSLYKKYAELYDAKNISSPSAESEQAEGERLSADIARNKLLELFYDLPGEYPDVALRLLNEYEAFLPPPTPSERTEGEDAEDVFRAWQEKYCFRVPYDGSNNFYDETCLKITEDTWRAMQEYANRRGMKLPKKITVTPNSPNSRGHKQGWNDCLAEIKRLNSING